MIFSNFQNLRTEQIKDVHLSYTEHLRTLIEHINLEKHARNTSKK